MESTVMFQELPANAEVILIYGITLPSDVDPLGIFVVFVGKRPNWHKTVIPALKRLIKHATRAKKTPQFWLENESFVGEKLYQNDYVKTDQVKRRLWFIWKDNAFHNVWTEEIVA